MGSDLARRRRLPAFLSLVFTLAACGGGEQGLAARQADETTKAAYNDDFAGVTQDFDAPLKATVKRSEVGLLSDQMHKLGDYHGLRYVSYDPPRNEYTYSANFSNGALTVVVRLDPNGGLAAYRILAAAN